MTSNRNRPASRRLASSRPGRLLLTLLALAVGQLMTRAASAGIECTPTPQWNWDGRVRAPEYPQACVTPLVVQLTDDNGDGRIDRDDSPDVVFVHRTAPPLLEGRLSAVDGLTGTEHFTTAAVPALFLVLSAADIDGDGVVELLSITADGANLVAFEHDGSLKWVSDPAPVAFPRFAGIGVADLDQDGSPEIFVGATVFDATGGFLWRGSAGQGAQVGWQVSHAVDLLPAKAGLELVAGRTVYDATGGIQLRLSVADGWTAVADFDGDSDPEVLHVDISRVTLFDHNGQAMAPTYFFGSTPASQPVAANLDTDAAAEAVLMTEDEVRALDWVAGDWVVLWSTPTEDPSRVNGMAAFDFDGDGIDELVYHDMVEWYVLDGASGAILHRESFPSSTGIETPVIADIDNDCVTEILVSGCRGGLPEESYSDGVWAYECTPAARARPLWNQYGYHASNVLDDGTIPVAATPPWLDHNSFLGQVEAASDTPTAVVPPTVSGCQGQPVTLDGSGSTGCTGGFEYRWLEAGTPVCDWSPDPLCLVLPASSPTDYTLEVRCTGLCAAAAGTGATTTVVLAEGPEADAGPDREICSGELTELGGSPTASGGSGGYGYLWTSMPPGLVAVGQETLANPQTLPITEAASFTVSVTDSAGCEATQQVLVEPFVPPVPGSVGNTMRAVKSTDSPDVLLSWTANDPSMVAFRLARGYPKAASYPPLGPDLDTNTFTDPGVIDDGRSYNYTVAGVNCTGVAGP